MIFAATTSYSGVEQHPERQGRQRPDDRHAPVGAAPKLDSRDEQRAGHRHDDDVEPGQHPYVQGDVEKRAAHESRVVFVPGRDVS